MFGIASIVLYVEKKDSVGDMKHLLQEITSIAPDKTTLKHGEPGNKKRLTDELVLGDFCSAVAGYDRCVACFFMDCPHVEHLAVANQLRELQDKAGVSEEGLLKKDGLIYTSHGIYIACQGNEGGLAPVPSPPPKLASSTPASSSGPSAGDRAGLKKMIEALRDDTFDLKRQITEKKAQITELTKQYRNVMTDIELYRPSGNAIVVKGNMNMTGKMFKLAIEEQHGFELKHQRLVVNRGNSQPEELQNHRRLFAYAVGEVGTELHLVLTGGEVRQTVNDEPDTEGYKSQAPALPAVHHHVLPAVQHPVLPAVQRPVEDDSGDEESSDEESIATTPHISDDDVEQEPLPVATTVITVKDFQYKNSMFRGSVDSSFTIADLKEFMYQFESLEEDQLERLALCDSRGNAQLLLNLKRKCAEFVKNKKEIEEDEPSQVDENGIPDSIRAFLSSQREKMAEIDFMKSQGHCPISMGLKMASVENLKAVEAVMAVPLHGKNITSESRVLQVMSLLLPLMSQIEESKKGLTQLQREFATTLLVLYAEKYHQQKGADLTFDNGAFLTEVGNELVRREVRPVTSESPSGGNCEIQ
eukprot:s6_g48.t1